MLDLVRLFAASVGLAALAQTACHREEAKMSSRGPTSSPERSVETLGKVVHLPIAPAEVWFEEIPEGTPGGLGPTDYMLVAVMRFDKDRLAGLTKGAVAKSEASPRILASANRPWFPAAVKGAIRPYDTDSVAVRGTKFDGAPFARGAFSSGSFVVVEGGEYVILVLGTT